MPDQKSPGDEPRPEAEFSRQVSRKEARKLKAQGRRREGVWFGLGTIGLVGWSVALPALGGALLGAWIDRTWPSRYSFTLMLLLLGLVLGAWNAWHWVGQERQKIEKDQ